MNTNISEKAVLYRINKQIDIDESNTIGAYIRQERVSQGLKQISVCKDICSVSYYSRIESNKVKPDDIYVSKIFKRLKRPVPILNQDKNLYNKEVIKQFLTAIEYNNSELVEKEYRNIQQLSDLNIDLYEFVYRIYNDNFNQIDTLIKKLHSIQFHFQNEELLLYLEYLGVYYGKINDLNKAVKLFDLSMLLQEYTKTRKASILYRYAWVLGKINNDYQCINYAQEADELFMKNHNLYRSLHCKLLLALKFNKYFPEKAISLYEECVKIATQSNYYEINKVVRFNLALAYKKMKQYKYCEAILLQLIDMYGNDLAFSLDTYFELIDLYILNNQMNKAVKYYKFIYQYNQVDKQYLSIYLEYFKYKLYNHETKDAIKMYVTKLIPYCKIQNNIEMLINIRKELINLYESIGDYKSANEQYKMILNY